MKITRRQLVLGAASAALLAACSSNDGDGGGGRGGGAQTTLPIVQVPDGNGFVYDGATRLLDVGGQRALLMVPTASNGHVVVYHHGAGENETAPTAELVKAGLVHAILAAGYSIASCAAHGDNWGNAAGCGDYAALIGQLSGYDKVIHYSQSMGGMSGLETVAAGVRSDGWFGIYPACDVIAQFDLQALALGIATAYGITSHDELVAAATQDPVHLPANRFAGRRMRFYASPGDMLVPKGYNTDLMAALVAPVAAEADVVVCSGDHADPSHFQPADVLAFLGRCVS